MYTMSEKKSSSRVLKKRASSASKAAKSAPKASVSFKRNTLPIAAGVIVMLGIMGLLNGQILMAQWQYHFAKPVVASGATATPALTAGPTESPNPELGPRVTIPAIGVEAPIVFEPGTAEWQIQVALRSGVVHHSTSAAPGETGNVVLFGHSSGQPWAPGDYKFIFTMLDKLKSDDVIYVDNNGTRYTYKVTGSQVVTPTNVGVMASGSANELTLITCTPVGTSTNRLVVRALQVSPDPAAKPEAVAAPAAAISGKPTATTAVTTELPASANRSFWQAFLDLF